MFFDDDFGGFGIRGFGFDLFFGDVFGVEDGDEGEEVGEIVEMEMNYEMVDLRVDVFFEIVL